MLQNGNTEAKDIAAELVLGQITVTIAPTRLFHPSGQVYLTNGKQKALNEAINAPGSMTERDGLAYLTLSINSAELDYLPSLGANIVHEGNHATIIARVIYTLSTGNSKLYENETWNNAEQRVKEATARYLKDRGIHYAGYGHRIGLLDSTGKNVQVKPFQQTDWDVQRFLTAGGIYWKGGGAPTCCPREE